MTETILLFSAISLSPVVLEEKPLLVVYHRVCGAGSKFVLTAQGSSAYIPVISYQTGSVVLEMYLPCISFQHCISALQSTANVSCHPL